MSSILADDEKTKSYNTFLGLLGILLLTLVGLLLNAYFLLLLWHWFVAPLGVRDLTYWQSAGLSAMLSYFLSSAKWDEDKKGRGHHEWIEVVKNNFKRMAFFFVIALLFHLLMRH